MNKKHWNTVLLDNSIDDEIIYKWVDDSYELVVSKLKKFEKENLNILQLYKVRNPFFKKLGFF
jgi:predicted DNA-binding protein (MmcQ/YjbR family)